LAAARQQKAVAAPTSGVKSAERALEILELVAAAERPLTTSDIGRALGYPRSSLHGLLQTMTKRHWLELVDSERAYALGIRTWEVGHSYLRAIDLADRAQPFMQRLRDQLDETIQLAMLDGRYNVYIGKVTGTQRLILASEVGRRLEAHATGIGKVLLSGLGDDELDRLFHGVALERFTEHTVPDYEALKVELEAIRNRGYGTDDEEYTAGVRCVAAPVRDASGAVVAAMSVSVPTIRDSILRKDGARLLLDATDGLSKALGHRPHSDDAQSHVAAH
jgi:DNA-binding IclR family transcriptional regulator